MEVAEGLGYLHGLNIPHGRLKVVGLLSDPSRALVTSYALSPWSLIALLCLFHNDRQMLSSTMSAMPV